MTAFTARDPFFLIALSKAINPSNAVANIPTPFAAWCQWHVEYVEPNRCAPPTPAPDALGMVRDLLRIVDPPKVFRG